MSEQTAAYRVKKNDLLPMKAHKLALRLLQIAKESGEYSFTLIVDESGGWKLQPPAKVEDLGQ